LTTEDPKEAPELEILVVETEFMPLWKRSVFLLKGMLASHLSRDPFNRPAGTGYLLHASRHLVPGYYQPVPPGQKLFVHRRGLALVSAYGIKTWAEGYGPSASRQKPAQPVFYLVWKREIPTKAFSSGVANQ
jgi:hypothetical protein